MIPNYRETRFEGTFPAGSKVNKKNIKSDVTIYVKESMWSNFFVFKLCLIRLPELWTVQLEL